MASIASQEELPIPDLNIEQRFAFLNRIIDGLPSINELSFKELYELWIKADFFSQLAKLGFVRVSYNNFEPIDFEPKAELGNRHQALALSCFVASIYSKSSAIISSPHEKSGIFKATFKYISDTCIEYVSEYGSYVRFTFDTTKPSQFSNLTK